MTDAEREAQIRRDDRNNSEDAKVATSWQFADKTFLLRLLNEVRAEIDRLEHLLYGRGEAQLQENLNICVAQKYEAQMDTVRLRQEIARLRAPLDGDAMKRAQAVVNASVRGEDFLHELIARALTAYGDQRAREAAAEVERLEKALADIVAESVGRLTEIARLTGVCEDWARQSQLLRRDKDTLGAEIVRLQSKISDLVASNELAFEQNANQQREIARLRASPNPFDQRTRYTSMEANPTDAPPVDSTDNSIYTVTSTGRKNEPFVMTRHDPPEAEGGEK